MKITTNKRIKLILQCLLGRYKANITNEDVSSITFKEFKEIFLNCVGCSYDGLCFNTLKEISDNTVE